jgi:hypothetical protein
MSDEVHTPAAGCNYRVCGIDPLNSLGCPFVKSKREFVALAQDVERANCVHEWQLLNYDALRLASNRQDPKRDAEFYCIHCLKIVKIQL